jgi:hypothetical protein
MNFWFLLFGPKTALIIHPSRCTPTVRNNFHHGFIAVEDLNGKGLAGGMLAKSVQDVRVVKLHRKVVL